MLQPEHSRDLPSAQCGVRLLSEDTIWSVFWMPCIWNPSHILKRPCIFACGSGLSRKTNAEERALRRAQAFTYHYGGASLGAVYSNVKRQASTCRKRRSWKAHRPSRPRSSCRDAGPRGLDMRAQSRSLDTRIPSRSGLWLPSQKLWQMQTKQLLSKCHAW